MTAPVVSQLNPSEVARNFGIDVKINGLYVPFGGLKNVDPTTDDANMEAENRYSDGGYSRSNKTGTGWNLTATLAYASQLADATSLDPALQFCLDREGLLGNDGIVDLRFYEFNPSAQSVRKYARQGLALFTTKLNFGDPTANRDVTLTFTGQGKLNKISHPYPLAAAVPTIASITPTGGASTFAVAGGTRFRMLGNGFTGATAISFGGTAATSFDIWSDNEITGVAPAKAAGSVPVTVTNGAGASAATNVTFA